MDRVYVKEGDFGDEEHEVRVQSGMQRQRRQGKRSGCQWMSHSVTGIGKGDTWCNLGVGVIRHMDI